MRTVQVQIGLERDQFLPRSASSGLSEKIGAPSDADLHIMIQEGNMVVARCSLWRSRVPHYQGHRLGLIGHFAVNEQCNAAADLLLRTAERTLAQAGCTLAIGPMDGSTSRPYRLVTEWGTEPPFFLEPANPKSWPDHFTRNGFRVLAGYSSSVQTDLNEDHPCAPEIERRLLPKGISIRSLDGTQFETELGRIYRVAATSFRQNFLATELVEEEFMEGFIRLRPAIIPELVLIAEARGVPVGFLFLLPNWLQAQSRAKIDTVIGKTLAVHPDYTGQGLGTLLVVQGARRAKELGYSRAIHALMHEGNCSQRISCGTFGQVFRRYALFAKEVQG